MIHAPNLRAGLIGARLSHSFSPRIHAAFADYEYRLIELIEQELSAFMQSNGFDALNVTIPYKQAVIPYLTELSDAASRIGAVNTVVRRPDGSLFGHNTDYDGFADLVKESGVALEGKKVLVLGSGGASRTVQTVAADMNAREIIVISREGENNYQNLDRHADAEVIVNTTPVGMYPHNGESPISLDGFPCLIAVLDVIYNPAQTALLQDAKQRGLICANGLLMLVSQARRAAELFTGERIDDDAVRTVTDEIAKQTANLMLIGMPGCGKSTLGRLIAKELGREFVDCDAEIVKAAGCPIPEIFATGGESAFRAIETEVLAKLSKQSSLVIATGGGVITRPENFPLLHQNSRVLFLDIAPDELPTAGRPLSQSRTPKALYAERLPLYRAAADLTLPITRDIEFNLKKIMEVIQ